MAKKKDARLRAENQRLRRENEYLRHRLTALGEKPSDGKESPFEERFAVSSRRAIASHRRTYFGYLLGRAKVSMPFRLWDKTRFAVRGFLWASKLWRLFVWIFVLLGFGTQFILLIGVTVILLPAAMMASLMIGGFGAFAHKKWNRMLGSVLASSDETIYIVFVPKIRKNHAYFHYMVAEMEKNGVVFLVFSSIASSGYRGVKRISSRLYALHISYYFSFRKHLEGKIVQICL